MSERYEVIIAGFGPVGQTAANLLGQRGFRVAVFETATAIYDLPRAAHFDGETMRVFQSTGLAEAVMPACAPVHGIQFLNADRDLLFDLQSSGRTTASGWQTGYMFYQPDLEAALQAGVRRFDNVEVHTGHEVLGVTQDDDGVEVRVRDLGSGAERTVEADWLLGCDGARSVARRDAGIGLEDLEFDQPWLVIDTLLKRDVDLSDDCLQICDPARPTTFVPSAGQHRRWEFMLMPHEDPAEMESPENVWRLLGGWVSPEDAEVIRAVVYSFHAVIAKEFRRGRIFLAGDSAHQMPPFLGQGMCAGIRDVANLTWKLDMVRRGEAGEALLDSYYPERSAHTRSVIQRAMQAGRIIQTTDPNVATARDEMFRSGGAQMVRPGQPGAVELRTPGLSSGLLAQTGEDSAAGDMFPQTLVERSGWPLRLDDALGDGFALVAGPGEDHPISDAAREAWAYLGPALLHVQPPTAGGSPPEGAITVRDREGYTLDWLRKHGAAVVRPDRYVYGSARTADELVALADLLRTQLGATAVSKVQP